MMTPAPLPPTGISPGLEGSFSANDRTFELSDSFASQLTVIQQPSPSKFNNPASQGSSPLDDRQLTGTGTYDQTIIPDFELEDDLDEIVEAKTDKS